MPICAAAFGTSEWLVMPGAVFTSSRKTSPQTIEHRVPLKQLEDRVERRGLRTTLSNINEVTGEPETIQLVTTEVGNGDLFYSLGVAPRNAFNTYRTVFNRIVGSLRLEN